MATTTNIPGKAPGSTESITIKASVLTGPKTLEIQPYTLPPLTPTSLRISISSTGLCGSDLHYYTHFRNGDILVREPLTLGHESVGVVTALGEEIKAEGRLKLGDTVVMEVGQPCESCELCAEGRYNICRKMKFRSSAKGEGRHSQGTLMEEICIEGVWCHKIHDKLKGYGALVEPLAVALHAAERVNLNKQKKGLKILVFGAGVVGLLCAAKCRDMYDALVVIADTNEDRVKWAVENGFADGWVVVSRGQEKTVEGKLEFAKGVAEGIKGMKFGEEVLRKRGKGGEEGEEVVVGEVDATFECTGAESCLQSAIYATKPGGKVVLIGMGNPIQTLPISAAALREVDLIGSFRYANNYAQAASELAGLNSSQGVDIKFEPLITQRFKGIESIPDAFAMAARVKDDDGNMVLKVVVDF
ncbi:chaperonin 10-like protein [Podospora fimiseda]|uniref:Chaperonin 10-like protein n=1 Tax=Podospora fimiseda TaxID=252190 RepID=A0AAN6YTN8_9PEZI|nr:chaperonin 10-like protein [Podospora fimiseda]